jgi:AraC-like DNA-binding protein
MRVGEQLSRFALYRRALISYVILVALSVIVLSISLYAAFSRQSVQDIAEVSQARLAQASYAADLIYDQIVTVGSQLVDERDIVTALYSRNLNRVVEYRANLIFNRLRSVYPFIRYMAIYNGYTQRYINTEGLDRQRELDVIHAAQAGQATGGFVAFYPRVADLGFFGVPDPVPVVSFVLYPNLGSQVVRDSFIFIHVDVAHIDEILASLTAGSDAEVVVSDARGTVIASSGESEFLDDLASRPSIEATISAAPRIGSRTATINGRRHLIAHVRSRALDWHFVSVEPYSSLLQNLASVRRITAALAGLVLALGVILSFIVTNSIHNPLAKLASQIRESERSGTAEREAAASEINELDVLRTAYDRYVSRMALLEDAVDSDMPLLRRSYAHSLLVGMREDLPPNEELAERITGSFDAEAYRVVLVSIDAFAQMRRLQSPRDLSATTLGLAKAMRHILLSNEKGVVVTTEENEIVALTVDEPATEESVVLRATELQQAARDNLGVTVTCAVSDPVMRTTDVHDALISARATLRRRFFSGPESILTSRVQPGRDRRFLPYPVDLERRLVESIRLRQSDEVERLVDEFCQVLGGSTYYGALALSNQLIVELLTEFAALEDEAQRQLEPYRDLVLHLSSIEVLDDLRSWLHSLTDLIVDLGRTREGDKKAQLVDRAFAFIEAHYSDPNLSLDTIAASQGVTPGYLGKVFHERRHRYVNDCVNDIRIARAKDLLSTTGMTAAEIAREVGIVNTSYFYTLFRKAVGTTPARYRSESVRQP